MNTNDELPAVESKQEFWSRHMEAWKESELSIREYCELEDLSTNSFGYWRRKLTAPKPVATGFVELKINAPRNDGLIRIRLQRGIELGIVSGTDTKYLGELVNALESP